MDLKVENGGIQEDKGLGWGKSFFASTKSVQEITVEVYLKEVQMVAEEIYFNLSLLMGMDRDACSRPDLVLGVSPRSDGNSLTLILQEYEISGLQIKHKEHWIPVKPIPGCLVVNIGDATD
ncbi:hypothetical protein CRYUN_Cryun01aG0041300 [Craigia yunnanensis]